MAKKIIIIAALLWAAGIAGYFMDSHSRGRAVLAERPATGVEILLESTNGPIGAGAWPELQEAIRRRFASLDFPVHIGRVGEFQVRVEAPIKQAEDQEKARSILAHQGWLEFRLVHEKSDELIKDDLSPPGYEKLTYKSKFSGDPQPIEKLVVRKQAEQGLGGRIVKRAMVVRGNLGEPQISFELKPDSAARFAEVTQLNVGRRLTIVFDGELWSAPTIRSPILNGHGVITGQFSQKEALELASAMESAFPVRLSVVEFKPY